MDEEYSLIESDTGVPFSDKVDFTSQLKHWV